jgi:SNF2 family DNA or RNA helicase
MAKHHWAITGTPIHNNVKEFYPYFKFLKVPNTGSYKIFMNNFCTDDEHVNVNRLQWLLSQFMIRRTHIDRLFGAPLLKLPKAVEKLHYCHFNDLERTVYDIVRRRFIAKINSFSRAGTLEKRYSTIMTMVLRLRQLTGHILTLEMVIKDLLEPGDISKLSRVVKAEVKHNTNRAAQIIELRKILSKVKGAERNPEEPENTNSESAQSESAENSGLPRSGDDLPNLEDDENAAGGGHGMGNDFSDFLRDLKRGRRYENMVEESICVKCGEKPDPPWMTSCDHMYCVDCLQEIQLQAARSDQAGALCMVCAQHFTFSTCLSAGDDDPEVSESQSEQDKSSNSTSNSGMRNGKEKTEDDAKWLKHYDAELPSAKTLALKAQILNWIRDEPNVKIIVYSQFLAM